MKKFLTTVAIAGLALGTLAACEEKKPADTMKDTTKKATDTMKDASKDMKDASKEMMDTAPKK